MSRWWEGMDWLKRPPEEFGPKSNVTPDFDIINLKKEDLKVDLGKPPVDRIFPTNEPTVQLTGKECSSETFPIPDVQRTVNDFFQRLFQKKIPIWTINKTDIRI
ncbi:hypothetical protein TNIN_442351 [Trichonephila inaurata madagascariensis]|uniref:Uncharacterized protein n=1 Tax=Trichonephila inaurata madagascariensis TaxID=2747483 RepID=A0A8X6XWR0_9ARAC|nr:hypothetical protein TNIN_442351 [Trichonephila inaurata madagascariensis]